MTGAGPGVRTHGLSSPLLGLVRTPGAQLRLQSRGKASLSLAQEGWAEGRRGWPGVGPAPLLDLRAGLPPPKPQGRAASPLQTPEQGRFPARCQAGLPPPQTPGQGQAHRTAGSGQWAAQSLNGCPPGRAVSGAQLLAHAWSLPPLGPREPPDWERANPLCDLIQAQDLLKPPSPHLENGCPMACPHGAGVRWQKEEGLGRATAGGGGAWQPRP